MDVERPESPPGPDHLPIDLKAAGFLPIGIVTPDGYRFARDSEKEDIDALGDASYVRSDITRVARTITFNAMETGRKHLTALKYGVDLSGVSADADDETQCDA